MDIFTQIAPLKKHLKALSDKKIGFVPTMGALHQGHLSLIKEARKKADIVVCSIFVNPLQFNNAEDLAKYPSSLKEDQEMLEEGGCDVLFLPDNEMMYSQKSHTQMSFEGLDDVMEGRFRPGHFSGVGVVVAKLFNIINPDIAFFGQKDLQQYAIIRQMVIDLSFGIELHPCPIIREEDGLAMSSRNRRLSEDERSIAPKIYETLILATKLLQKEIPVQTVKQKATDYLNKYKEFELEYLEIVDANSLSALDAQSTINSLGEKTKGAICIAAHLGNVRLIDNMIFAKRLGSKHSNN